MENKTFEIHYDLDAIKAAYANFSFLPELKVIQVAGTNGKGSTIQFLKCLLEAQNRRVGVFTSPSITTMNAMFQVSGKDIEDEQLQAYFTKVEPFGLSLFEQQVLIALLYFYDEQVDVVLLECGMGGRLDATSVVSNPILSILTNIGMDHQDYLGTTKSSIVWHKAGIAKKAIPFVCGEQDVTLQKEIKTIVEAQGALFYPVELEESSLAGELIWKQQRYTLPTRAKYQQINARLALCAMEAFQQDLDPLTIQQALSDFSWPGRFEVLSTTPTIVVDGAHNVEGIASFIESSKELQLDVCIFAALADKPVDAMLALLAETTMDIIVTEFDHPRSAHRDSYQENTHVRFAQDVVTVMEDCLANGQSFCVIGSLYFVGAISPWIKEKIK
ncbi:MAG: bifunctional folylpolyglutamate synthase/dihydrofolate synthase [Erysipelotrichaceae bacterium]